MYLVVQVMSAIYKTYRVAPQKLHIPFAYFGHPVCLVLVVVDLTPCMSCKQLT